MTMLIALIVQPALSGLDRSTLPPFFRLVFGAAASALLVAVIVKLGVPITGGLVLTGSLLRFLPGYALVSGFRDLIDQSMISGSARLAEALLLAAGVAGGTLLGLAVATRFDVHLTIETVGRTDWGYVVAGLAAFVAVGAFAIRLGVPKASVGQAAALGGAAWLAFIGVADAGLLEPSLATLGAAIIIGVVGRFIARRMEAPAALWVVPAILPLLPGSAAGPGDAGPDRRRARLGAPRGGRDRLPRGHGRRFRRHPGPCASGGSATTWSRRRSTP